jgi:hypothetical protein
MLFGFSPVFAGFCEAKRAHRSITAWARRFAPLPTLRLVQTYQIAPRHEVPGLLTSFYITLEEKYMQAKTRGERKRREPPLPLYSCCDKKFCGLR